MRKKERPTPTERLRRALRVAETVAIIIIALNLLPQAVRNTYYRYFEPKDDMPLARDVRTVPYKGGKIVVKEQVYAPKRLEPNSEQFVNVILDIEGLPRNDPGIDAVFTIRALGLTVQPPNTIHRKANPSTGVSFLVTSTTSGTKRYSIETQFSGLEALPDLDAGMYVNVVQPNDWFERAIKILDALGIPALLAALAIEYYKRRSTI